MEKEIKDLIKKFKKENEVENELCIDIYYDVSTDTVEVDFSEIQEDGICIYKKYLSLSEFEELVKKK